MSTARTRPAGRTGPTRPTGRPQRRVAVSAARAAALAGQRGRLGTRGAWLVAGALTLLALALAWTVLFSSFLAARDIAVTGGRSLTADEVIASAKVPLGRPLARLDLAQITRNTAAVPAVREVHVYRRWPHTVEIEIVERTPVAVVAGSLPGDWFYLDVRGVVFGLAPPPRSGGDPDTSTVDRSKMPQVTAVAGSAASRAAGEVLVSLPAALRNQVISVQATSPDAVVLTLPRRQKVMWGNSARSARKAAVLKALLVARPSSLYDVSSPDTPTVH